MLSDLQLVDVTEENLPGILDLQLHEHQQSFLPSIQSSIELAANYPDARPLAIRVNGQIGGFALYGIDEETGSWKIFRLYLDKGFQSRGLGKQATQMLLDLIEKQHEATEVLIVYKASNKVAQRLFEQLGFREYARNGERVLSKINLSGRRITST